MISFVASIMKMREMSSEKISSVKRVKNRTMFDSENALRKGRGGAAEPDTARISQVCPCEGKCGSVLSHGTRDCGLGPSE